MRKLNKLYLIVAFMFVGYSCEITDLDQLNNPNAVTTENAGIDLYWNSIQTSFPGWWYGNQTPMLQLARVACMTGGSSYAEAYTPSGFNGSWDFVYSGLVPDIDAMIAAATETESWVYVGAGKILKGYALQMLVDKHGAIPYSEAWQGTANLSPKVDDAQSVYTAVAGLYDEAIADLGKTAIGAPAVDIFYGGDVAKWVKLANTLKFRMALNEGNANGVDTLFIPFLDLNKNDNSITGYPATSLPRVSTTFAKQLALYVTTHSPLQMAADFIENYEKHPKAFEFIKSVPVSWDTTIVLNGEIEQFLTIARKDRNSDNWYIGGITNRESRTLQFNLSFLDEGSYLARIYADGDLADWQSNPLDYKIFEKVVSKSELMTMKLASGGGQAIELEKIKD